MPRRSASSHNTRSGAALLGKGPFLRGILLDEPEAPLSPQSQLGLIAMIPDMVAQDAQSIDARSARQRPGPAPRP